MEKVELEHAMDSFRSACKAAGLKVTPQRTIIYNELIASTDHPSIDNLYRRVRKLLPNISFDTVYRTVLTFSQIGIASIVDGYGGSKRFDPNMKPHHHFRCINCQSIIDFYHDEYDNMEIPPDIRERFTVLNKRVQLEGICERCVS